MRRLLTAGLLALTLVAVAATGASADQGRARTAPMLLGVMDDALLGNVPDIAFPAVQQLHPQVIRYDLSWAHTAPRKPADATNPDDPAYDWSLPDQVVVRAAALNVPVLLTIEVTPRWAGGGTGNKAPVNMASLQGFAYAAATRYSGQHIVPSTGQVLPPVTRWEAWNEPNTTSHLAPQYTCRCSTAQPKSPGIYAKILTAIFRGVHAAGSHAGVLETVAGGATKPNYSGPKTFEPAVAPLRFALLLGTRHPPLDVYSHHPYRTDVGKKVGQLPGLNDIGFADLPRLVKGLDTAFPGKHLHLWITEFGLQTNPPDSFQGVSLASQSQQLRRNVASARANPRIDMLVWFLIRDEQVRRPFAQGFQTGLSFTSGQAKPSWSVFRSLAQ
ncbi:MAG TPA: hypothetical protein VFD90_21015 [Gaiellales bacterium]|jgi:hypothetical protein|nr:hypothetical protein [Gaiellales bacterium]